MAIWLHNEKTVEVICSMSKQKKPDAHIKIELTAEEYMKRAGEEHNRIVVHDVINY